MFFCLFANFNNACQDKEKKKYIALSFSFVEKVAFFEEMVQFL